MNELQRHHDADELGFDVSRLARIDDVWNGFVDRGQLPGYLVTVARGGQLAYVARGGWANKELDAPVMDDTIWRIYSMTKPLTSLAAMMLYEEGAFDLNDPASRWIDSLAEPDVYVGGTAEAPQTRKATEPVRIWHLLSHTAGLTYGFTRMHPVDEIYRLKGYDWNSPPTADLATAVEDWCSSPLLFNPGEAWNYSVATDVVGRLVELWSGQDLSDFLQERILSPLKMYDTGFYLPEEKVERLAQLYVPVDGRAVAFGDLGRPALKKPRILSGGGGLTSTAHDYNRFLTMLLRGGELDGVRLVAPSTLALMTENHLPGGQDLSVLARDSFSEVEMAGMGFGLGFATVESRTQNRSTMSNGSFMWGGAASTTFWVDPAQDLTATFFTQLLPSSTYAIRRILAQGVYQALKD